MRTLLCLGISAMLLFGCGDDDGSSHWTPEQSVQADDTFSDLAGTWLDDHIGETVTWTRHPAYDLDLILPQFAPIQMMVVRNNRLENDLVNSLYFAAPAPSVPEYTVEADITILGTDPAGNMGLVARCDPAAEIFYAVHVQDSGMISMYKYVNGIYTPLGWYWSLAQVGQTVHITLEITDATKRVLIDGAECISSTDNEITAAGHAGVLASANSLALDNVRIIPAPAP